MLRRTSFVLLAIVLTAALAAAALAASSGLHFLGTKTDGSGGVSGIAGPDDVAVSPDGGSVYVTGGVSDSVAAFDRKGSGKLSFVNAKTDGSGGVSGLSRPINVAVSPDSRSVYVTSSDDSSIVTFDRSKKTGKLSFVNKRVDGVNGVEGLGGAYAVAVSADGRNVFVGTQTASIASFSRDQNTGKLTFVNAKFDGTGGVQGIANVDGLAVSADSQNVYTASGGTHAVATFAVTGKRGKLAFVNAKVDGSDGVSNLGNAYDLDVSRDGRNVYVVSEEPSNALVIFKRSRKTGKLNYVASKLDGQGGVSDMSRPLDVAVSRDGRNVYVAAYQDGTASSLVAFKRSSKKGKLSFLGAKSDGSGGVDAEGIWRVAISKDGKNLYTANYDSSSTSAFERDR